MTFEEVLPGLKAGAHGAKRDGWHNVMGIYAQAPDAHSKMGHPYLYAYDIAGKRAPWLASQVDLFATDWQTTSLDID